MNVEQLSNSPWLWRERWRDVEVGFFGRATESEQDSTGPANVLPSSRQVANVRQVHGATVLDAEPGCAGDGDGLVTTRRDLALTIVTADCVPVLLASPQQLAAVHAGWRGIAAEILDIAIRRLDAKDSLVAWIGPAIGSCCYEVGDEVATEVAEVSHPSVVQWQQPRPHLNLIAAVSWQLQKAGVQDVRVVDACTSCASDTLWSYRRQGVEAGRNIAAIWRL